MLALAAIALGLLLGLAAGGSVWNLSALRLRFEWLILPLFLVQGFARGRLLGQGRAYAVGLVLWLVLSVVLTGALLANWRQPGLTIAALGLLFNLDIILANGGMPVELGWTGDWDILHAQTAISSAAGFYHFADQSSILSWLGDAMPLRVLGASTFFSVGDVLLAVGVVVVMIWGMLHGQNTQSRSNA